MYNLAIFLFISKHIHVNINDFKIGHARNNKPDKKIKLNKNNKSFAPRSEVVCRKQ